MLKMGMHLELVKKRWVYANKECTLNTAIMVRITVIMFIVTRIW